ncbi:MAG: hypothetical protein H6633_17930 [Anaerolineales bacterium]|nr:hypothetical protein [Anaerolineales bacterium]
MTQSNQDHTPPNSQDSDQNHPEPEATDPPAEPVDIPAETDSKKVDQLPTEPPASQPTPRRSSWAWAHRPGGWLPWKRFSKIPRRTPAWPLWWSCI